MNTEAALPPFRDIEAALRTTTERLACEVAQPSASAPRWNDFEWLVARSVTALQGIAGLLATRLRWRGPEDWHRFLHDQHGHVVARHTQVATTLASLERQARIDDLPFVPLKGSALQALGIHQPGERSMADIDLLVRTEDAARTAQLLGRIGYQLLYAHPRHDVFTPVTHPGEAGFGEHRNHPLKIEIHHAVAEVLPVRRVDITASLWPAAPRTGANAYASRASLMRHLLLHTAANMHANSLRLIQLYDIARLSSSMTAVDWSDLIDVSDGNEAIWWVYPPLVLSAGYFPDTVPDPVVAAAGAACPPLLRRLARRRTLYEVSLSNLRVVAFPGFEWSRTPLELLRFVKQRVLPSVGSLREFEASAPARPMRNVLPWFEEPRGKRLLRWLFSNPPRVATILAVMAAQSSAAAISSRPS
jgi:hypothetical protein